MYYEEFSFSQSIFSCTFFGFLHRYFRPRMRFLIDVIVANKVWGEQKIDWQASSNNLATYFQFLFKFPRRVKNLKRPGNIIYVTIGIWLCATWKCESNFFPSRLLYVHSILMVNKCYYLLGTMLMTLLVTHRWAKIRKSPYY